MSKGVKYMLISVAGFSLMNLTVKYLHGIPATELVFFRSLVSLSLCLFFLGRKKVNPFGQKSVKKYLILRGVFGVTALSLFFWTLQQLPLGSAIVLQYLSPIFTSVFALFLLRENVRPVQWLFFAISFIGIALIRGFDPRITTVLFGAGILSAVFAGLAYICIRKIGEDAHPLVVVFYFPLIATPVMGIISSFNWTMPEGKQWLLLLLMGVFTQIAQLYMTKAYQVSEVNKIVGMKYLGIVPALFFDYLLFDYSYSLAVLLGILLVVAGVLLNILQKQSPKFN